MFELFTERADKVMQLADQEAQRLNQVYVGSEHILLGLMIEGSGGAATILKGFKIDLQKIQLEIARNAQTGFLSPAVGLGKLPLSPQVVRIIKSSLEEARNLGTNCVGTNHLLLALLRDPDNAAAQVLVKLGLNLEVVRQEVLGLTERVHERQATSFESLGLD